MYTLRADFRAPISCINAVHCKTSSALIRCGIVTASCHARLCHGYSFQQVSATVTEWAPLKMRESRAGLCVFYCRYFESQLSLTLDFCRWVYCQIALPSPRHLSERWSSWRGSSFIALKLHQSIDWIHEFSPIFTLTLGWSALRNA